jgi:tRNA modification GTPase
MGAVLPPDDTIVAIATPLGRSAIGVVRLSGAGAPRIARILLGGLQLQPRLATYGQVTVSPSGPGRAVPEDGVRDEAIAVWFPSPRSYTGEDVVEISAHGNPLLLEGIVRQAIVHGARLALPGEFTLRAVIHGKRTVVEAEAVADLIQASTLPQARLAFDQLHGTLSTEVAAIDAEAFDLIARLEASLDFPDEGYHFTQPAESAAALTRLVDGIDTLLRDASRGRLIREGATVVIAGRPNVGKSRLFNAVLGGARAIVTDVPGTTRDMLTERVELGGVLVTLADTAGVRDSNDPVEQMGVGLSQRAIQTADLVVAVIDGALGMTEEDARLMSEVPEIRRLLVANKCDLPAAQHRSFPPDSVAVSALTGDGVDALRLRIGSRLLDQDDAVDAPRISNVRHVAVLTGARQALARARALAWESAPEEIVLRELHTARSRFDELIGARTSDDVLNRIFARFCIGK